MTTANIVNNCAQKLMEHFASQCKDKLSTEGHSPKDMNIEEMSENNSQSLSTAKSMPSVNVNQDIEDSLQAILCEIGKLYID